MEMNIENIFPSYVAGAGVMPEAEFPTTGLFHKMIEYRQLQCDCARRTNLKSPQCLDTHGSAVDGRTA